LCTSYVCNLSYYNIKLSSNIVYCSHNNLVRKINSYKGDVILSSDPLDIVLGLSIGRRRLNRQDMFMLVIPIYYRDNNMRFVYDHMYEYSISTISDIICKDLNTNCETILLYDITMSMYFLDTRVNYDDILLHTMLTHMDFFPRERNVVNRGNSAKLVHLTSLSHINVKNYTMESITLSNMLDIDFMSDYTLVNIKVKDNDIISKIMLDISDLITYICNDHISYNNKTIITSTKHMRSIVSDLFVQRFSRESANRIAMIDECVVDYYRNEGYHVLEYESRFYMSVTKGKYIGLKTNRLPNKNIYKYIPAVYNKDHSKIEGTNTYNYLHKISGTNSRNVSSHNLVRELNPWEFSIAPNCVLNMLHGYERETCIRVGVPSSMSMLCNHTVTDDMFVLCKQELPHLTSLQIRDMWYSHDNWHYAKYLYRLLEHLFNANVVILDDRRDHVVVMDYSDIFRYVWNPVGTSMLLLLRTRLSEYKIGYEIICHSSNNILVDDDKFLYNYGMMSKLSSCSRFVPINRLDVQLQYLNSEGKCVLYKSYDGSLVGCLSAPVISDYIDISLLPSALSDHLDGIRQEINIILHDIRYSSVSNYSYDVVVDIFGRKYYRSEMLDKDYIPQVLLESTNVNVVDCEDEVYGDFSIIKFDDKYLYYMLLD